MAPRAKSRAKPTAAPSLLHLYRGLDNDRNTSTSLPNPSSCDSAQSAQTHRPSAGSARLHRAASPQNAHTRGRDGTHDPESSRHPQPAPPAPVTPTPAGPSTSPPPPPEATAPAPSPSAPAP